MTKITDAQISVVMPTYNAAKWIEGTLESVAAQTRLPREVVVVDDGSADSTCSAIERFAASHPELQLRLLRAAHRGPGAARNVGVRAAAGEWVAFLDSDDLWDSQKLAVTDDSIARHPDANIHCHNERHVGEDGLAAEVDYGAAYDPRAPLPAQLYRRNLFSTSAVVCRRDVMLCWNGFDETLSSAQDYELWLRMSPDLRPVFVRQVLGTYVRHGASITSGRLAARIWNIARVKHRHRSKGGLALFAKSLTVTTASLVIAHAAMRRRPR